MNLLDTLERRLGHLAIPRLIHLIVILNALVFLAAQANPAVIATINLNREAILQGHEYWRLFTYIFIPGTNQFVFLLLALMSMWMIGNGLEQAWGSFKVNLFYLIGMIGTTVAALLFGADYSNFMLNASLFFAFAWFYGDMQVFIMMIIPVRVRWAAWAMAGIMMFNFMQANNSYRAAMLMGLANYFLFFGPILFSQKRHQRQVALRREAFEAASLPEETPLYCCHVCQRTELKHPTLSFRVGRDGNDYCEEHLPKSADAPR